MKKNGALWLFVISCLLAIGVLIQDFRFDASFRQTRSAAVRVERATGSLRTTLAELRGGQTAYLATGQGPEFWMRRVSDLAAELESGLRQLTTQLETPEARAQVATASTALADLLSIDKRAREALEGEQRFLASDIVFAEGLATTQTLVEALSSTATIETTALDARLVREARIRLAMTAAGLVLVMVSGLVLAQSRRNLAPPVSPASSLAQMLRELPPPVKVPLAAQSPIQKPTPPVAVPISGVDLTAAAELCVDLARVLDAEDIPALLERAAKAMEATGVVVWVVNRDGDTLAPVLSHGYSDRVLALLGRLEVAADNITSVCFRTMRPQSIPGVGHPGATSAIAVPLVTSNGCNGVLAAELPVAKPSESNLALARIIAAQFATMISPTETADSAPRAAEA